MARGAHRSRHVSFRLVTLSISALLVLAVLPPATLADGGLFLPYQAITVPSEPDAVAVGDVTGDGRDDIVVTTGFDFDPPNDFRLLVLAQTAAGGLAAPVSYATSGSYTARPGSVDIGDVNGDGRDDVVVGLDRYGIELFPQLADGTLGTSNLVLNNDSTRIRVGPIDKSGRPQVAGIGWGSGTITIFADTGAGLVAARTYPVHHDGWDDIELADVTGDVLVDLVVMSGQGPGIDLSVLPQLANGTFAQAVEYVVDGTNGIGVGDVTGDGRNDIVASVGGNQPSSGLAVLGQAADGTLAAPVSYPSYDIPEPVEVADFDLDGRADVVTLHGGWLKAGVYRGSADGTLAAETLYDIPYASQYSVHGLAVGDINSDSWPDVVAADYNNGVIVLRNATNQPPNVPGAPSLLSVTPGDGRVTATWSAPASDGGAPITSYSATASPGTATCVSSGPSCTITGLSNGTSYTIRVRATNDVGQGPASNPRTATPGVAPSAPRSLSVSPNLSSGIGLSWQPPASGGSSPVSGYRIYRGAPGGTPILLASVDTTLSFTDTAVTKGGSYVYEIGAVNAFAEGPHSSPVGATRGTTPSAPQGLTASVTGQGITLRWSPPAADGGAALTAYTVFRGTTAANAIPIDTVGGGVTSYVDKSGAKKTTYVYRLTASNVLGDSVPSNTVTATSR
jgi:hypothetical protein